MVKGSGDSLPRLPIPYENYVHIYHPCSEANAGLGLGKEPTRMAGKQAGPKSWYTIGQSLPGVGFPFIRRNYCTCG